MAQNSTVINKFLKNPQLYYLTNFFFFGEKDLTNQFEEKSL